MARGVNVISAARLASALLRRRERAAAFSSFGVVARQCPAEGLLLGSLICPVFTHPPGGSRCVRAGRRSYPFDRLPVSRFSEWRRGVSFPLRRLVLGSPPRQGRRAGSWSFTPAGFYKRCSLARPHNALDASKDRSAASQARRRPVSLGNRRRSPCGNLSGLSPPPASPWRLWALGVRWAGCDERSSRAPASALDARNGARRHMRAGETKNAPARPAPMIEHAIRLVEAEHLGVHPPVLWQVQRRQ